MLVLDMRISIISSTWFPREKGRRIPFEHSPRLSNLEDCEVFPAHCRHSTGRLDTRLCTGVGHLDTHVLLGLQSRVSSRQAILRAQIWSAPDLAIYAPPSWHYFQGLSSTRGWFLCHLHACCHCKLAACCHECLRWQHVHVRAASAVDATAQPDADPTTRREGGREGGRERYIYI